jgi:hypothetical protein
VWFFPCERRFSFLPALVWAPSFSEQQAGIDAANSAANAAQNAVMQVTKSLTELTAENGQIKASVKEVSEKVDKSKKEAIDTAHTMGAKAYVTINIFAHNADIEKLPQFLELMKEAKPDALIFSDAAQDRKDGERLTDCMVAWDTAPCDASTARRWNS